MAKSVPAEEKRETKKKRAQEHKRTRRQKTAPGIRCAGNSNESIKRLEKRLGFQLTPQDFADIGFGQLIHKFKTPRHFIRHQVIATKRIKLGFR